MKRITGLLLSVALLASCGSPAPEKTIYTDIGDDYYADEIVAKGVKNFSKETPSRDDVHIIRNYGVYDGAYVNSFIVLEIGGGGGWFQTTYLLVDEVELRFPFEWEPLCWKDHVFCTIQEAFDGGWLTHEDLEAIQASSASQYKDAYSLLE